MATANSLLSTIITEQEYLQGEKDADHRHEYNNGCVVAMAGSSKRHNTLALNIVLALRHATKGSSCEVYASDIKVRISRRKSYYYPDVMVGCEEDDNDDYYVEQPCFIVEVLSASTKRKDSSEKLLAYQDIDSLQAYMMVDQERCHISLFYRQDDGQWWVKHYSDMEEQISVPCPAMALRVADVYEGISLS